MYRYHPYQYRPLASPRHISVLAFQVAKEDDDGTGAEVNSSYYGQLIQVSLDDAPRYECVSYVWGAPDRTAGLRMGTDAYVLITPSLGMAIVDLTAHHSRTGLLWIDQICIDQDNVNERNHQVHQMGRIFALARRTVVYLGPPSDTCSNETVIGSFMTNPDPHSVSVRRYAEFVLSRAWFTRGWIVQEILRSRRMDLCVGRTRLGDIWTLHEFLFQYSIQAISSGFQAIQSLQMKKSLRGSVLVKTYAPDLVPLVAHARDTFNCLSAVRATLREQPGQHRVARSLLVMFVMQTIGRCDFKLTDPRDRIIAFVDLVPSIGFTPDYNESLLEIHVQFAKGIARESGRLDFLAFAGRDTLAHDLQLWSKPSWLPTWERVGRDDSMFWAWLQSLVSRRGIRKCTPSVLNTYSASMHTDQGRESFHRQPEPTQIRTNEGLTLRTKRRLIATVKSVSTALDTDTFDETIDAASWGPSESVRFPGPFAFSTSREALFNMLQSLDQTMHGGDNAKGPSRKIVAFAKLVGRHIIQLVDGRLGVSAKQCEPGDKVVILHGCRFPVILAEAERALQEYLGDCWNFVSEAGIPGIMRGEAVTWDVDDAESFALV